MKPRVQYFSFNISMSESFLSTKKRKGYARVTRLHK